MPELTPENLNLLNNQAEKQFVEKAKNRVREFMQDELLDRPDLCFTDEAIDTFTELGIKRAREHYLISEGEIFDYLHLMLFFGADFDRDAQHQWLMQYVEGDPEELMQGRTIHAVLRGRICVQYTYASIEDKIHRYEALLDHYQQSRSSQTNTFIKKTARQLMIDFMPEHYVLIDEKYHQTVSIEVPELMEYMLDEKNLPQQFYQQSVIEAKSAGITGKAEYHLWFVLSLDLGKRFHKNPLYPDINKLLSHVDDEKALTEDLLTLRIACLKKRLTINN